MLNIKPSPVDMIGDFVTAVTEIKVWEIELDDTTSRLIEGLVSSDTITIVSSTETDTNVWTLVFSDESSTTITDLVKIGEIAISTSNEDTNGDDRRWDCTLVGGHSASPNGNLTEPVVGSFVYYLSGSPVNAVPADPTWLTMTAAEYTKWM